MPPKLSTILLIDDMKSDSFLTSRVVKKAEVANNIVTQVGGQEALDYLKAEKQRTNKFPELIFLDINMPGMDGWEFLRHYELLPGDVRDSTIVCLLTTSDAEEDRGMAKNHPSVRKFCTKPITEESLEEVMNEFFAG